MVRIIDEKTGVPNMVTGMPVDSQSLRGITEDGMVMEKHWDAWPEHELLDYMVRWSSDIRYGWDVPYEAFRCYNYFTGIKVINPRLLLIGPDGNEIRPKGDNLFHCEKHDRYVLGDLNRECFYCQTDPYTYTPKEIRRDI